MLELTKAANIKKGIMRLSSMFNNIADSLLYILLPDDTLRSDLKYIKKHVNMTLIETIEPYGLTNCT